MWSDTALRQNPCGLRQRLDRLHVVWDSAWTDSMSYETALRQNPFVLTQRLNRLHVVWHSTWTDSMWSETAHIQTPRGLRQRLDRLYVVWDNVDSGSMWSETVHRQTHVVRDRAESDSARDFMELDSILYVFSNKTEWERRFKNNQNSIRSLGVLKEIIKIRHFFQF